MKLKNLILFENFNHKEPSPISRDEIEYEIAKGGKTPFLVMIDDYFDSDYIDNMQNNWEVPGSVSSVHVNTLSKILNKKIVLSPSGYTVRERPLVVLVTQRDLSRLPDKIIDNSYIFITDRAPSGAITGGIDYRYLG